MDLIFIYDDFQLFCKNFSPFGNNYNGIAIKHEKEKWNYMRDYISEERLFSALASSIRLEILDTISNGFANHGEIAEKLNLHRSSIEKHLHILVVAGIIEKEPSLNKKGQLSVKYRTKANLSELLSVANGIIKVHNEK